MVAKRAENNADSLKTVADAADQFIKAYVDDGEIAAADFYPQSTDTDAVKTFLSMSASNGGFGAKAVFRSVPSARALAFSFPFLSSLLTFFSRSLSYTHSQHIPTRYTSPPPPPPPSPLLLLPYSQTGMDLESRQDLTRGITPTRRFSMSSGGWTPPLSTQTLP